MIEQPPKTDGGLEFVPMEFYLSQDFADFIKSVDKKYYYWDKIKYKIPAGKDKTLFWTALRLYRFANSERFTLGTYEFSYPKNFFAKELHEFDMNFGGSLTSNEIIPQKDKNFYQISSIMEEAIASSQIEGSNTTRKVAKEMLRRKAKPKDRDQQMIFNNYKTIQFLVKKKDEPLTKELLLQIHKYITENTLDKKTEGGVFRTTDNIVVQNSLSSEIVHLPPKAENLPSLLDSLCNFANKEDEDFFVHPIIKAIIIHFLVSYLHPFVDGNGRTARSLFYWFMLKKGYWLTEYLSISRVIYKSKSQYENAFLYAESDNLDLGYFIDYNLGVMQKAYSELQQYLEKKTNEKNNIGEFALISGINERQAQILKAAATTPDTIFILKEWEVKLNASIKTVRSDFQELVKKGLLKEVPQNKRLVHYARADNFDLEVKKIN